MCRLPQINRDCPGSPWRCTLSAVAPWPALLHFGRGSPTCCADSFWLSSLSCLMRVAQEGKLERNGIQRPQERAGFCLWSCLPPIHPPGRSSKTPAWPCAPHLNSLNDPSHTQEEVQALRPARELCVNLAPADWWTSNSCLQLVYPVALTFLLVSSRFVFVSTPSVKQFLLPRVPLPAPLTSHPLCLANFHLSFKA